MFRHTPISTRTDTHLPYPTLFRSFLVTTISFSLSEIAAAQGLMLRAAVYHAEQPQNAVWQALYLADLARKRGRLALQNVTEELRDAPFLHRAISMVVDGLPADEVERKIGRASWRERGWQYG